MSQGIPGADSTDQITHVLIEEAAQLIGATPQFWGRYFCNPSNPSPYEYTHLVEDRPLSEKNIKLLPIAEQTWRVAGSQQEGVFDAQGNVDDLIETFGVDYLAGIGQEFLMFLDVEGSPPSNPSLSAAYYQGWAQTLASVQPAESCGPLYNTPGCLCLPRRHPDVADPRTGRCSMPRNLDRRIWYKFAATPSLECESGDAAGSTTYMPSSGLAICGKLGSGSKPRL